MEGPFNVTSTVTFDWRSEIVFETCCWSITNLRFIESNDGGQTESNSRSIETCVTEGSSTYQCDGGTWLCTQPVSKNGDIPTITKLTSDSYQLENTFNNLNVQRHCTPINFMSLSQSPPSQLPCYIEPSTSSTTITSSSNPSTSTSNPLTTFSSRISTLNIQPTSFPVAINCEQEGIWHQTSEGRNATVVGACYNGTANGMSIV